MLAVFAPEDIVMLDGGLAAALSDEIVTFNPPAGAGPERVSVHVLEEPPAKVEGEHASEDGTGGWTVTDAVAVMPL
jgi:hypothetical protein